MHWGFFFLCIGDLVLKETLFPSWKNRKKRRKTGRQGGRERKREERNPLIWLWSFVPCLVYFCCPHHPLANSYEDSGAIVCLLPGITASLKVSIKSLLELEWDAIIYRFSGAGFATALVYSIVQGVSGSVWVWGRPYQATSNGFWVLSASKNLSLRFLARVSQGFDDVVLFICEGPT